MATLVDRLRERIAELPHRVAQQPNDDPNAAPAPGGRRRRRQPTEAQLTARRNWERQAHEKYERKVAKAETAARDKRFKRHRQIAVFCGITTHAAKQGPNLQVFIAHTTTKNDNLKARGLDGRLSFVDHRAVHYTNSFGLDVYKEFAADRYQQARALEVMEATGALSKPEADMAARHIGAWTAAIRKAKELRFYTGNIDENIVPYTEEEKKKQLDAREIYDNLLLSYDCDVDPFAVCHAVNFYMAQGPRFPAGFGNAHLDAFVMIYAAAMVYQPDRRAANLARAGCIERVRHEHTIQRRQILNLANESMAAADHYTKGVITIRNAGTLRHLDPIAHADALPVPAELKDRDFDSGTFNRVQAGDELAHHERKHNFISQASIAVPRNFENWAEWGTYFFPDADQAPTIPYSCIPRVHVAVKGDDGAQIVIKLRLYYRELAAHLSDAVVFIVWEDIRLAASRNDPLAMDSLYADLKKMINGESPPTADDLDDQSGDNMESEEQYVEPEVDDSEYEPLSDEEDDDFAGDE
jgi:hypothetical protein